MITTLTTSQAISEALIEKYVENPLGNDCVKWCLKLDTTSMTVDTYMRCIWIDVCRMDYKSLAEILQNKADLGLLFPDQLYHCYCIFVRCGINTIKLRGGEHCDRYSE